MTDSSQQHQAAQKNRQHERHELHKPIPVINVLDGQSMGALVNITVEGLMLLSNQPIECDRIYQISLSLPQEIIGHDFIELGVDCLWARGEEQYHRYWAGFQIIDASHTAIKLIENLIRENNSLSEES